MINFKEFFDHCRSTIMAPRIDADELKGSEAILKALEGLPVAYVAYALATAWHETAHTMQPIKEYGGDAYFFRMYDRAGNRPHVARRLGNTRDGDGVKYAGRGYVQLTGRQNYERAGLKLNKRLSSYPDMALRPDIAAAIMREGMLEGWFTARKFSTYLPHCSPAGREEFRKARRIINGSDKDRQIAGYALTFQDALLRAGWR